MAVYLGDRNESAWRSFKVTEGYGIAPPSLLIDTTNHFHLAWHDIYEDVYGLSGPTAKLGSEQDWEAKKLTHEAWRPVMAEAGDKLLAVIETNYSYLDYLLEAMRTSRDGITSAKTMLASFGTQYTRRSSRSIAMESLGCSLSIT